MIWLEPQAQECRIEERGTQEGTETRQLVSKGAHSPYCTVVLDQSLDIALAKMSTKAAYLVGGRRPGHSIRVQCL